MQKIRLDKAVFEAGLVLTRSQAESYIRLGKVLVNGKPVTKPGTMISSEKLELLQKQQYVSRAGMKLESVASYFNLDFRGRVVLDVGSSTGGFTDFALKNGVEKVIAVEVGVNQLHTSLRGNEKIELHEQTDIRDIKQLSDKPDMVVVDVSFISLREILPHVSKLISSKAQVIAMVKPQFEAKVSAVKHKGVIKNEKIRREILKEFELWSREKFVIINKKDSEISGEKGNTERFYLLKKV